MTFSLCSQDLVGVLKGKVFASEDKPLPGVVLRLKGTDYSVRTDEGGAFELKVAPGDYVLVANVPGMDVVEIAVNVEAGKARELKPIRLTRSLQEISEVIVSGKRRKFYIDKPSAGLRLQRPLLEIPQNIQVIGRGVFDDRQVFNVSEGITAYVSGVRLPLHHKTYTNIFIRGFSASRFRNGMEIHNYFGPLQEDMSYVDRIEFVKGPAGFMVGNSEPGGFYNVVTKEPTATDKTGVHLAMGSFGTYRLETDVNRKLSHDGKLLFRLNAMGNLQGSHISYTSYDGYALAPSLKYLFSDKTSLTLQYIYQYVSLEGGFGPYIYSKKGFKDAPRNMSYNDPVVKPVKVNDHSVFATFKHEFSPDWQLTAKLGYLDYRMRGEDLYPIYNSLDDQGLMKRQLQVRDVDNFTRLGQVFLNGKFETGPISHRLLTGLDLGNKKYFGDWTEVTNKEGEDLSFNIFDPVYRKIDPDQLPYIDRSRSLRQRAKYKGDSSYRSLYFHDEISFWADRLRLSLGGRYTYSNRLDKNGLELEDNAFTPRVALSGNLTKNTVAYALFDESFVPQDKPLLGGGRAKPLRGKNYEIGLKKEWADGKWMATLAAFKIIKTNILAGAGPNHPGLSVMSGEAQSKGIELDIKGEILPQLDLIFNYAYTDAKITKDDDPIKVGAYLPGSARHATNAWATYRFGSGSVKGLGVSLGYEWEIDRAEWPGANSKRLPDDYFKLSAGVSYARDGYNVCLVVDNLTDRYNYTGFHPGTWGYKHYGWQTLRPINYRLSVSYEF